MLDRKTREKLVVNSLIGELKEENNMPLRIESNFDEAMKKAMENIDVNEIMKKAIKKVKEREGEQKRNQRGKEFIEQDMYHATLRLAEIRARKEELQEITKDEMRLENDLKNLAKEYWEVV